MKKGNSKNVEKKILNEDTKKIMQKKLEIMKQKKVNDYEEYFKDFNLDEFSIDSKTLKEDLEKFVPKPVVRTYDDLKKEAREKIDESLKSIKFGTTDRDEFFLSDDIEMEQFKAEVDKNAIMKSMFEFAFICGNYTKSRKWIRFDSGLYFCLPTLLEKGNHAMLVTFFADKISNKLNDNMGNAITAVLEKKDFTIEQRRYCFSKGHLLANDEERKKVLFDLKVIFSEMKKQQNDRDFSSVSFLAKKKDNKVDKK